VQFSGRNTIVKGQRGCTVQLFCHSKKLKGKFGAISVGMQPSLEKLALLRAILNLNSYNS
jgi:hypothetical protein